MILCIVKPKYGVYGIFVFSLFVSNALQSRFVYDNRGFSTPFSVIGISNISLIDSLGTRLLILVLFISTILRKKFAEEEINHVWVIKIIVGILLLSILSIIINDISFKDGLSSVSLFIIALLFFVAVANISFTEKDIKIFLYSLLVFVFINSLFEIYQFFIFALGDVDMTFGLLESTTPTSTLAFVVCFFFIGKISLGKIDKTVILSIFILITQLVASYLKGLVAFAIIILISFRKLLFSGGKKLLYASFAIIIISSVSAYIFTDAVTDYDIFYQFNNVNIVTKVGPVRVWTQYFQVIDNPVDFLIGFGPSSYGSINTFTDEGIRKSKLGELVTIADAGDLAGRDLFGTALSSAGNILWENGIIILFLFLFFYYKIYKMSSDILTNSKNEQVSLYAFGVKYEIMFMVLLYFAGFGSTTEELLLWGPAFVVFSFINSESQIDLNLDSSLEQNLEAIE